MRVSEALLPLLLAVFAPRHGAAADVATNEVHTHRARCSAFSEQAVSKCLQPILKYASTLQEKTGAVQFPIQGGNIFKELCSIYLQFKECTKSVSCHSLSIDAVDASYGYMCGAGYQLFEDHSACFAEIEREHDYIACKNAANDAMEDATKAKRDDLDAYFRSLCGVMDEYLRCCRPLVNRRCGREAWDLVSQVTVDSLKVTMPTCEIRKSLV
ncbi:hypothetical protein QR680_012932 [Steinernema hermaphroditum]|uniref:T20D4.11-like domain-containing protein n=1 Tax=Steinernema hermaphroditum TaxID=289476 RepID=A0AA39M1G4_9BILA|nr:hypothetical protein QR680_012932 [Steinernema hermaphroditum]